MGAIAGRVMPIHRGVYDPTKIYNHMDMTTYNNALWWCLVDNTTGIEPVEGPNWHLVIDSAIADAAQLGGETAAEWQEKIDTLDTSKWDSGLWSVQPWIDGEAYDNSGYNYAVDYQLEANTTYTISISEDDGQTMYVGSIDKSVTENGLYQTFTTDENGIITIWLISGRREQDYYDGVIKACIVEGTEVTWQGQDISKIKGNWAFRVSVKTDYPYNRFLDILSPFGKYFSFNTGSYNENHADGETWCGLTLGDPTNGNATEAGFRLEVPNGGVDFSFLNSSKNADGSVVLAFNMGINENAQGAKYLFGFNEDDLGVQYNRFIIEKGAIPFYLTADGIKVKEDGTATEDPTEGNWKTINLYQLAELAEEALPKTGTAADSEKLGGETSAQWQAKVDAKLPSAGGTMGGTLVANATSVATLGTKQMRNIYAGTSALTAGSSALATGDIYIQYE